MKTSIYDTRVRLIDLANKLFLMIVSAGQAVRNDTVERLGIQIFIGEVNTFDYLFESIGKPTAENRFTCAYTTGYIRNSYLSNGGIVSFYGVATIDPVITTSSVIFTTTTGTVLQATVTGLLPDENIVIALLLLAQHANVGVSEVIAHVYKNNGKLPQAIHTEDHYLHAYLGSPILV